MSGVPASGGERSEPRWVPRRVVDAVHADLIRTHGGAYGVRDEGLLHSALDRPIQRWIYTETADLAECAAAYGFGIAKNHAFVDGNKRTAFQIMYVFLGLDGLRLIAPEPEIVALMINVASGAIGEAELAGWIRAHTTSR